MMLTLPEVGVARSVSSHNVRVDVLADWVEGSILFVDEELSHTDVVDALIANTIYDDQDFALERVLNVWVELGRRSRCLADGPPYELLSERIVRTVPWRDRVVYSFCLLLSLQGWYRTWAKGLGHDFTAQGELFERITKDSLAWLGWQVRQTGWSRKQTHQLQMVVEEVANSLGEQVLCTAIHWTKGQVKEAGVDVVCWDPFKDAYGGRPLFLLQCASGANWSEKTQFPNLHLWAKLIDFSNSPQRGFCMPYCLSEEEFYKICALIDGLLLDRCRLADGEGKWVTRGLRRELSSWMRSRVAALPRSD